MEPLSIPPPQPVAPSGKRLRVLFAAKRIEGTGNYTTSTRIADIFTSLGCDVQLLNYASLGCETKATPPPLHDVQTFDVVVALHALHGYQILMQCILEKVIACIMRS